MGVIIEGCPAGIKLGLNEIQKEVNKRKPGQNALSTQRKEQDKAEVLSGVLEGITTGAPICLIVFNEDIDSSKYEIMPWKTVLKYTDFVIRDLKR